ncbi:MAG: nucleotide exchange factor GrpE [Treponema sp.]|nr:nucleotide exchange factor GrpE [Treponema sp.]
MSEKDKESEKEELEKENQAGENQSEVAESVSESTDEEKSESAQTDSEKSELDKANEKISELEKQVEEYKDKYLRSVADFQNLRKRSIQEKQEAFDYANTNLLKDLLDSLDNFDRTVDAAATATDPKSIADGVKMINKSLVSMLENNYNLVAYGAVGDAFDPDIHEAIGKSDDPVAEPVLKAVYLKGYKLKDRVIRHAKVMVSMPDGSVKADEKSEDKPEENKAENK